MSENTNTVRDRVVPALLVASLLALIALLVVVLVDSGDDSAAAEVTSVDVTTAACRSFLLTEAEVNGVDGAVRKGDLNPAVLSTYETASSELREIATVDGIDADVFEAIADMSTGMTSAKVSFTGFAATDSYNWITAQRRLATLDRLATAVEFACEPHLS